MRYNALLPFVLPVFMALGAAPAAGQVRISEFMAVNQSGLQDEDGDYSDWIELHNAGGSPVNLGGWRLTDTADELTRWTLPSTNLAAGAFLLVYASGKDRAGAQLHANFSLASEGEYLALVQPDGTTVAHEYAPSYPEQYADVSYGVQTQGTNRTLRAGRAGYLIRRTPGAANTSLPAPHPLYSDDSVARVDMTISQSDWDSLMNDPWNETYRNVKIRFRHGDIDVTVSNVGIRCRGNTSREKQPRSFNLAFNTFVPGQRLYGMERMYLNADANDPSMARPKLLNDLSNALDLHASYANHVALAVYGPTWDRGRFVGGAFFDAVRNNTQPVDDVFLQQRYGADRGNLYKCNTRQWQASLEYRGPTGSSYIGDGTTYELKHDGGGDTSYNDLAGFIAMINHTNDAQFPNEIMRVFDVDDFLKRMALDVLTGNWDNYWVNANNYHLFFNPLTRRWVYIPYDFDNAFGITWIGSDWGQQDIYDWADISGDRPYTPLAARIFNVPEFKKRYTFYMKQMLDTVYSNSVLNPGLYHYRTAMTSALAFAEAAVPNMKARERTRYSGDWPYWSYDNFFWSYVDDQGKYNGNVPNDYGVTNFISLRSQTARAQLDLQNIAPILSGFAMSPSLPRSNDAIAVSVRALDDGAVTNVQLRYSFRGGSTNTLPMILQGDGAYAATLPALGTNGTLRYFVQATDNTGRSGFHPFGGTNYALTVEIGSASLSLAITEVNYNPYPLTAAEIAAGVTDDKDLEFVEVFNTGNEPLQLAGFRFVTGITCTFPSFTLNAGERAVIVKSLTAFPVRYTNAAIRIIGAFSGSLANEGERLALLDAAGLTVKDFTYDDGGDWPGRADGKGSSLEALDPAGDYNDPSNWRSSSEYGGSPGAAGLGPDTRIAINELLTHTDPPLCDAIELFNRTEGAVDLGGWYLTDTSDRYKKYRIPDGTILPAGGYITFNETNHFNTSGGTGTNDFALDGAHGDDVYLMEADAAGNLRRFVDHPEFGAAANGESFGRWPNGSGRLYPMVSRTFGAANSGPRVGPVFISEIMYNPPGGSNHLEFVEIVNPTAQPVDLTRWQLDDGIAFQFTNGTSLPAGGVLVVLPFNPAAASNSALLADFRSVYGISTEAPLAGGYSGALDNGGERVRLLRPDDPPAGEPTYYPMLIEDEVRYDDDLPWPGAADGGGSSLERNTPAAWGDDAANWTAAAPSPGAHGSGGDTHALTIVSAHGFPVPAAGQHVYPEGRVLTNSVPTPDVQGATRYLCEGWTLAGHAPESGATNWMVMTLTNDAVLTWRWATNYMLSVEAGPGGRVEPEGGWQAPGAIVGLEATASNLYTFAGWSGDTNAITAGGATSAAISVTMAAPVSLTAHFASETPVYYASPTGSHTAPFTSWASAATSLQVVADYAPAGATVLVAAATYPLGAPLTLNKALHVRGVDGPAATVLDGGGATRGVSLSHAEAVVEGFTIRRGNSGANSGGGVRIDGGGTLRNCILYSNLTMKSGGGAALIGGGELRNCLLYDNTASERGGGVFTYTDAATPAIQSCTLARNAAGEGGGVYLFSSAVLLNSVAWGNVASSGSNILLSGSGHDIRFCSTGPAMAGAGNSGANPLFAGAAQGDFRPADASPCINAGTNQAWMPESFDLDGRPRVVNHTADQGAYEVILPSWDTDGNGLPDWWEWEYHGRLVGTDPDGDPDGDGMPNKFEYPAGTDPNDGGSLLRIEETASLLAGDEVLLRWQSAAGRRYSIGFSADLLSGFAARLQTNIAATPPINSFTGSVAQPGPFYFRIELE